MVLSFGCSAFSYLFSISLISCLQFFFRHGHNFNGSLGKGLFSIKDLQILFFHQYGLKSLLVKENSKGLRDTFRDSSATISKYFRNFFSDFWQNSLRKSSSSVSYGIFSETPLNLISPLPVISRRILRGIFLEYASGNAALQREYIPTVNSTASQKEKSMSISA